MRRRYQICGLMLLVCGMFLAPTMAMGDTKKARPNILFIAIDDLNDWCGVLGGHPQARTPNLDKLAKRGVMFANAYCSAPACNPSRASLMHSIRPSTSGVYINPQDWRRPMQAYVPLNRYFMQNGYYVWGGGKIFHGAFPDAKGWNEYYRGKGNIPRQKLPPDGIGGNMRWGPVDVGDEAMPDTQMTSWAIGKLKQDYDKPFFLAVGYVKPHLAWHAPKKYFDMHPLEKVKLPKVNKSDLNDIPPAGIKMAKPEGDHRKILQKKQWKKAVQAYLATSTFMDGQLGRLFEALANSRHAENTIIILWSDHGWHLGEKEHWRKFALWEEATRVPFLAVVPGVTQPNQKCTRPVTLLDIYPTLVDLAGLPTNKQLEGHSLVPLLKNPETKWAHPAITTHGRNNHAVRTEKWRYIRYADGSEELYDHTKDKMEWTNVAKDARYAKVKVQLAKLLPKKNVPDVPRSKRLRKRGKNKEKNSQTGLTVDVRYLKRFSIFSGELRSEQHRIFARVKQ